ncbi:Hsp70 family protein, partial [Photobacterium damselae subsp. damselae]|nr:Hsp70 family protein [Photobacterium damselae subsp. damselae]
GPRGMAQIEVTFDLDADGILNVSAKDKATGKEQKITIQASSGLSEAEIEKMVQEAEANKEADKKFEELVTARNQADHLIHTARKQIDEAGDNLAADVKTSVENAIKELEEAKSSDDKARIDSATQTLTAAMQKVMEQAQASSQAQSGTDAGQKAKDDDVIDAEFEEMK